MTLQIAWFGGVVTVRRRQSADIPVSGLGRQLPHIGEAGVYPANLCRFYALQVEVMFGGSPMALLSHQERPNASLRANPPRIGSSEPSTCPE